MIAAIIAAGAGLLVGYFMRPGAQVLVGVLLVFWGAIVGAMKNFF